MSDTETGAINPRDLIWPIVAMFATLVSGIVALALFLPESRDVTAIVSPLFAAFTSLTLMVGGWVVLRRVRDDVGELQAHVEETKENTARVVEQTNGNLDRRIREIGYQSMLKALEDHERAEAERSGPS